MIDLRLLRTRIGLVLIPLASVLLGVSTAESRTKTLLAVAAVFVTVGAAAVLPELGRMRVLWSQLRWWQPLWLFIFLSGLVLRARDVSSAANSPLDAAALYRVALVAVVGCAIGALVAVRRFPLAAAVAGPFFVWLLIFNFTNLASTAWSINPQWTAYRSAEFLVDTSLAALIAISLLTIDHVRRFLDWTWMFLGFLLLSVAASAVLAPGRSLVRLGVLGFSVQGVYPQVSRNAVGYLGAVLLVVAVARIATGRAPKRLYIALAVVSTVALVVAQTRGAIAATLLATALVLVLTKRLSWLVTLLVVAGSIALSSGATRALHLFWNRGETSGNLASLTGRTNVWSVAWSSLTERPLTGYGAFSGGRFQVAAQLDPSLSSAHGTFPELVVDTSFWGVVPIAVLLIVLWLFLLRRARYSAHAADPEHHGVWGVTIEAIAVLAVVTVDSFFSVNLIWHPAIQFLAVVVVCAALRRREQACLRPGAAGGRDGWPK